MSRYALALEYNGAGFCGRQSQPHARNVQDCVERALGRVADHPIRVSCAGRADAGAHACERAIHFDAGSELRTITARSMRRERAIHFDGGSELRTIAARSMRRERAIHFDGGAGRDIPARRRGDEGHSPEEAAVARPPPIRSSLPQREA